MPASTTFGPTGKRPRRRRGLLGRSSLGWARAGRAVAVALAGAGAFGLAVVLLARPNLIAMADRVAVGAGFGVAASQIRGAHFASEQEIAAALALDGGRSHLTLDLGPMRQRVEALAWVRTANVQRILPDALAVEITERKPAALWRGGEHDVLVDGEGRTLSAVQRGSDIGLPLLTGEGAGPAAGSILALIRDHGEIERRLVETRRIAQRRWTLVLTGGTLLHLPGDGVAAAMAWLEAQAASGLLDRGLAEIDLRVAGQLTVREGGNAPVVRDRRPQAASHATSALGE